MGLDLNKTVTSGSSQSRTHVFDLQMWRQTRVKVKPKSDPQKTRRPLLLYRTEALLSPL